MDLFEANDSPGSNYAIERYRNIFHYYPKEAKAHAWLYLLLARDGKHPLAAARARRRAARKLRATAWQEYQQIVEAGMKTA